jgi:uncharacterized protein YggE
MRWRHVVVVLGVVLAAGGLGLGWAYAQVPGGQAGVRVVGQGRVATPPDVAVINLGASVLRERPDVAFDRAEQLITAVTAAARAQGVAERDVVTGQVSLSQEFRPGTQENPQPVLTGWRARHSLSVKVRDFARVGRVLADAVAALEDGGEVQGISFTVEDNRPIIEQARDAALQDAREKAERIASRLGVRLGAVTFVQETSAPAPVTVRAPTAVAAPIPAATPRPPIAADISAAEQVFSVTVEVHYAIEGAPPR